MDGHTHVRSPFHSPLNKERSQRDTATGKILKNRQSETGVCLGLMASEKKEGCIMGSDD